MCEEPPGFARTTTESPCPKFIKQIRHITVYVSQIGINTIEKVVTPILKAIYSIDFPHLSSLFFCLSKMSNNMRAKYFPLQWNFYNRKETNSFILFEEKVFGVIAISETWLLSRDSFYIRGYHIEIKDWGDGYGRWYILSQNTNIVTSCLLVNKCSGI